ncbi:hypothetical protein LZC95_51025 [Pendulispora brunnea]|uniref:Class IIb bacteriocin, lactobin A/cerein 7B family n=1 Tax=Pendulispora brunnea TaxID=2905690 RepID=A0ABZ2K7S7_9BACT
MNTNKDSLQTLSDDDLAQAQGGWIVGAIGIAVGIYGTVWAAGHAKGLQDRGKRRRR